MNTETIKTKATAELTAIYTAGGRYVLSKVNGVENRAHKALKAVGVDHDASRSMIRTWVREVCEAMNVDIRGNAQ